jgi:hypothetical protein
MDCDQWWHMTSAKTNSCRSNASKPLITAKGECSHVIIRVNCCMIFIASVTSVLVNVVQWFYESQNMSKLQAVCDKSSPLCHVHLSNDRELQYGQVTPSASLCHAYSCWFAVVEELGETETFVPYRLVPRAPCDGEIQDLSKSVKQIWWSHMSHMLRLQASKPQSSYLSHYFSSLFILFLPFSPLFLLFFSSFSNPHFSISRRWSTQLTLKI